MGKEVWHVVPKYPNYEISETLLLRNRTTKYIKKFYLDENGYLRVNIQFGKVKKKPGLHQLVAMTFIPNPESKPEVNHKDCNKLNNHWTNLEWLTREEHRKHTTENELNAGKIKNKDVVFIRQNYFIMGQRTLADKYGVSEMTIMSTAAGWSRKTVKFPPVKILRRHCIEGCLKAAIDVLTGEIFKSVKEVSGQTGFTERYLKRAMSGERPNYTSFRYYDHDKGDDVSLYEPLVAKPPKKITRANIKKVGLFTVSGEFKGIYDSQRSAADSVGIRSGGLSGTAKGKTQFHCGFVAKYVNADGSFVEPVFVSKKKPLKAKKPKGEVPQPKKIIQLDLNGNELRQFDSMDAAVRFLGTDRSNFRKKIKGKRGGRVGYYKGHFYRFVEI